MSRTLREQLIGTWRLVSYIQTDVDSGVEDTPMGVKPEGLIMYTPDGYMSAQLGTPGRRNFKGGDLYRGTPDEYVEEGSTYMAYSGPFYLDEAKHLLQHEMEVSLFPNWKGQRQVRVFQLDGQVLHLGTDQPMKFAGSSKTAALVWNRVKPNL